ncbi:MAG: carbohydrate kinase, partial [Alicyclobacillaceae bacterium]|nr:carbohydrate kinase [Alicyclobacillaceae bacterium]
VPGWPVQPVDTTGAGDTFVGSFLYQYANRPAGFRWEAKAVEAWVRFSVAASALVTTRPGAIPALPTRDEVNAFLAGRTAPD